MDIYFSVTMNTDEITFESSRWRRLIPRGQAKFKKIWDVPFLEHMDARALYAFIDGDGDEDPTDSSSCWLYGESKYHWWQWVAIRTTTTEDRGSDGQKLTKKLPTKSLTNFFS